MEGVVGSEVGYTVAVISNLVLLTRQATDRLLVYAVDPDLGTPVADVNINAFSAGKLVGKGTTDRDGVWSKNIPLTRELQVFASKGRDFALGDPSYYPANLFNRKVYLTTERPVA